MIKAIIVDDEAHCVDTLTLTLQEYCPQVNVAATCRSGNLGLEAIKKHEPDLVFLDIEMPTMNGFEMLEQLASVPFAVIFTTSYDQYAIRAIRFSALDYLLKPIDPEELVRALIKVQEREYRPLSEQFWMLLKQMNHRPGKFDKIAVPSLDGFELIAANQILHCTANDNYTRLGLKDKSTVMASRTLKEIEEQLSGFDFFIRVHHSHVVNLNEVTKYVRGEGGYLIMSDGSTVNVSRSRKESLMRRF